MMRIIQKMMSNIISWIKSNSLGLGILGISWLVFFGHIFFSGNVFFLDDLKIFYYPLETAYAESQANWSLPQWSTTFGFGQPLLSWGQLGFFTPLHALLRLFSVHPLVLLQISVATYFLAGLVGTYIFFRTRKFSQTGSSIASLVFVFCGFSIGHLNHVNFYTGTMLLPYLLLALEALRRSPSIQKAILVAVSAAAIALSSQPQITLFVFIVAGILTAIFTLFDYKNVVWKRFIPYLLGAGVIGAALASYSLLPLLEFLPETERASALPMSELFEFSYPPSHAITLLLPYFYGDQANYWGAKGFQELAAFVGLIPLVLSLAALLSWKTYRAERTVGLVLIVIALAFGLGKHSFIYQFLVENHYVTSLGVASRFVFFFDVGVLFLAAVGLEDIRQAIQKKRWVLLHMVIGVAGAFALLIPFLRTLEDGTRSQAQLLSLWEQQDGFLILVVVTAGMLLLVPLLARIRSISRHIPTALVVVTAITLVSYSWSYNPSISSNIAFEESPITSTLLSYGEETGLPARLYARPKLIQINPLGDASMEFTDAISPLFSAFQPIQHASQGDICIDIPLESKELPAIGSVAVGLHNNPLEPAIETHMIDTYLIGQGPTQQICFASNGTTESWLSFTSEEETNIVVGMQPQTNSEMQAYLVRKENPTPKEWERSQKPFQLSVTVADEEAKTADLEAAHLARHLNVTANTSSARWIGALSIREYRNFIEFFFANDSEPVDGDNKHVLERNRKIFNLAGITHLAQLLPVGVPDGMQEAGFELVSSDVMGTNELRLYTNPEAFPKAFMVPSAIWKPAADETRDAMRQPDFDPEQLVYLSGPKPIEEIVGIEEESIDFVDLAYSADITEYSSTRVSIRTVADKGAYLLLTDSTTPQWQTYIDGVPADQYVGNSIFKAAYVPAGEHTVTFQYESPAIRNATWITVVATVLVVLGIAIPVAHRLRSDQ